MYRARQVPASDLATATESLKGRGVRLPEGLGCDDRPFRCSEWAGDSNNKPTRNKDLEVVLEDKTDTEVI